MVYADAVRCRVYKRQAHKCRYIDVGDTDAAAAFLDGFSTGDFFDSLSGFTWREARARTHCAALICMFKAASSMCILSPQVDPNVNHTLSERASQQSAALQARARLEFQVFRAAALRVTWRNEVELTRGCRGRERAGERDCKINSQESKVFHWRLYRESNKRTSHTQLIELNECSPMNAVQWIFEFRAQRSRLILISHIVSEIETNQKKKINTTTFWSTSRTHIGSRLRTEEVGTEEVRTE